jgi:putative membrane protein
MHMSKVTSARFGVAAVAAAAALLVSPVVRSAAAQAKLDDPTIVAIFDAANTWDVESASLGVTKGTTPEIRNLAKMFVHDHEMVRGQGRDLAKKLHVTPTPPKDFALAKTHADAMKRLKGLKGAAFDKAFLENEVGFHKAVIDAMNTTLAPAIQNAELKELVVKVAPAFQAHMMAAQHLLDQK